VDNARLRGTPATPRPGSEACCSSQVEPFLTEKSRSMGAPPSCDVLFYSKGLNTTTGRHRDAFTAADLADYYERGTNPFERNQWMQTKGTDVLIFSMGNTEMQMGLSFPLDKGDAAARERYIQPPGLRIPLIPGTVLVYSPFDDLFYCHEARFQQPPPPESTSYSSYRVAFVFRWLNECMERLYYVDPAHGGRHVPDEAEAARRKKHKRNAGSTWTH